MYDYEFAKKMRGLSRQPKAAGYREAKVERVSPLTFSICGGEILAPPMTLTLTQTARSREWRQGDKAAALLGGGLLILDKI